jgi:hypothetical protein
MKRILFISVFAVSCFTASFSQIVIAKSNYPVAGDSYYMTTDTNFVSPITFQSASASGPWDFSTSLYKGSDFTQMFRNVSDYPGAATQVPTADLAIDEPGFISLINTANGITTVGLIPDGKIYDKNSVVKITGSAIALPENAKLNDQFSNVFRTEMKLKVADPKMVASVDSIIMYGRTKVTAKFDAEGTLTLPSGTYSALRLKRVESDSSAGSMHSPQMNMWIPMQYEGEDTSYTYEWFVLKNNKVLSVLKLEYDNTKNLSDKRWYTNIASGINTGSMSSNIFVYPTITSGVVNIKSSVTILKVSVFDLSGKMVFNNSVTNGMIDISKLKSGFYSMKIMDSNGNTLHFEKIIKK